MGASDDTDVTENSKLSHSKSHPCNITHLITSAKIGLNDGHNQKVQDLPVRPDLSSDPEDEDEDGGEDEGEGEDEEDEGQLVTFLIYLRLLADVCRQPRIERYRKYRSNSEADRAGSKVPSPTRIEWTLTSWHAVPRTN